ncbi:MAG: maltose alpha-D-glucosyltransferase [Saprospiraceae bacterium]
MDRPGDWFKDAIIYQVHPKTYMDSNGDGIGDFNGLISKLDYIKELGVNTVWVMPFYPSPLRDDGYDIADYYHINPSYGTREELQVLIDGAHQRNLRVIIELVINHTSDQHEWFKRAKASPPDSSYRNYYVWSDNPEKYKGVRIIFTDTHTSNWTKDEETGMYYWHRFFSHQPDLNFDNPDVQEEIFKVMDYWAAAGIDGFRLDAIPYLFEREGTSCENLPETHAFLKKLRSHLDQKHQGLLFLSEANMWPEDTVQYFGESDECHMNYHFPVMPRLYLALKKADRTPIEYIMNRTPQIPEDCQWAVFLRCHDELTLEMVTLEDRNFMWDNYAADKRARINLGIRKRLATLMDNDQRRIRLMNAILFSLPGTPLVYYGDEIGMGDNIWLNDRDGVRTPMQWNAGKNGGFSDAPKEKLYLPIIESDEYHYTKINVEAEEADSDSLLHWMRNIISIRNQHRVFGRGTFTFANADHPSILSYWREFEHEVVLVVINLSDIPRTTTIDLNKPGYASELEDLIAFAKIFPEDGKLTLELNPYDFLWMKQVDTENLLLAESYLAMSMH